MNAWQVVCGEDVRRKEVAQCGNTVVVNVSEQMGSGGLCQGDSSLMLSLFVVSCDSWFDCSILFSSPPFQTLCFSHC